MASSQRSGKRASIEEVTDLARELRNYVTDEGIDDILCDALAKCFHEKPLRPIKFIADQLYLEEDLTIPGESENSKDDKIFQLQTDVEYYKSLINSLKTGADDDTKYRLESAESFLQTSSLKTFSQLNCSPIVLNNGVQIQLPQMTPGGGYSFTSLEEFDNDKKDVSSIPNADTAIDTFFHELVTGNGTLMDAQPSEKKSLENVITELMEDLTTSTQKLLKSGGKDLNMLDRVDLSEESDSSDESQDSQENAKQPEKPETLIEEPPEDMETSPNILIKSNELISPIKDLISGSVDMDLDDDLNNNQQIIEVNITVSKTEKPVEEESECVKSQKSLSDQRSELSSQSSFKTVIEARETTSATSNIVSEFASDIELTQNSQDSAGQEKDKDSEKEEEERDHSMSEKEDSESDKDEEKRDYPMSEGDDSDSGSKEDTEKEEGEENTEKQEDSVKNQKTKEELKHEVPPIRGLDLDDDFNPDYEDDDF